MSSNLPPSSQSEAILPFFDGSAPAPISQDCVTAPKVTAGLRERAEAAFRKSAALSAEGGQVQSLEEARVLLYELGVHQIELEMQNDELLRTQEALDAARGRYFDLYDLAPVGYVTMSEDWLVLEANLTAGALLELPRSKLVGLPLSRFIQKEDADTFYLLRNRALETGSPQVAEVRMAKRDGALFWVELMASATQDEAGFPVWRVVMSDISERRHKDELLRRSETKQGKLLANIADVIVITDQKGLTRYMSPNVQKHFGWCQEECVGASTLAFVHSEDLDSVQKFMDALAAEPEASGLIEFRYRCKEGAFKWIEFSGVNLSADPDIQGLLGTFRDLSERKQHEAMKMDLEAQFQQAQKMESIGRLAGGVAHDFNNMLAATILQLNLLMESPNLDEEDRVAILSLEEGAKRAAKLTRQLLLFSRKTVLQKESVYLDEVVDHLIEMLRRVIGEDYNLVYKPQQRSLLILGDVGMIEQVLLNLAVNARDAMPEGGLVQILTYNHEWVESACVGHPKRRPGQFVCLEMIDSGGGIPEENLAIIFEPFFTTKEVGKGTGLGLSTVDGIVNQHKGWVEVESAVGKGTAFRIYFPLHSSVTPVETRPASTPLRTVHGSSEGNATILLVEDEAVVRRRVRDSLLKLGYRVLEAETPSGALELWKEQGNSIDLLLTDMVMPGGMTGMDLVRQLHQRNPQLAVIVMSGYSEELVHQGLADEPHVVFIPKPFDTPSLSSAIRRHLEAR